MHFPSALNGASYADNSFYWLPLNEGPRSPPHLISFPVFFEGKYRPLDRLNITEFLSFTNLLSDDHDAEV